MPTPPGDIDDYIPDLLFDPNTIGGANGSSISSYGDYTSIGSYAAPTLKTDGLNGYDTALFAPSQALRAAVPAVAPPPGNLSLGAFPSAFSAVAVIKPTNLDALTGQPLPRRNFIGFRNAGVGGTSEFSGWAIKPNGKQEASLLYHVGSGWWGTAATEALATISEGAWYVLGLRTNGQTCTLWKGRSTDRTATNSLYASNYTQYIDAIVLGADATYPGRNDFAGEIAYFAAFDRAITNGEYLEMAEWLISRFGLPSRDIAVTSFIGTTGKDLFISFTDPATGDPARINAEVESGITYKVNGGSPVVPALVIAPDHTAPDPIGSHIAIPLASPADDNDVLTVSIPEGTIATRLGPVDVLVDGAVINYVGDASMISDELPESVTMEMGYNVNSPGAYWSPECSLINIFKCNGEGISPWTQDDDGYRTSPTVGFFVGIRMGSGNAVSGDYHVFYDYAGAEFGRYVVSWTGADGSNLSLITLDDQTTVTSVPELDVLTGSGKKRYFDVAEAPGSIRKRPSFAVRYNAAVYCTAIDVRLARYEGVTTYYADQIKSRLNGMRVARFMDFQATNYSNIAHASDFCPVDRAWYGDSLGRDIPISRIESYEGPHYAPDENVQHYMITFSENHGLVDGQSITIVSTNGSAINVVLSNGTVDLQWLYWFVYVLSPTTAYMAPFVGGGKNHASTVTPFTGANAVAQFRVRHGAPLEMSAALVNEADIAVCHVCIPHPATDEAVQHMATVLANSLDEGKELWIEPSNEPWNPSYIQWQYLKDEGVRRGLETRPSYATARAYSAIAIEWWDLFKAQWIAEGRDDADLKLVLNTQHANPGYTQQMVDWFKLYRPEIPVVLTMAPYYPPNPLQQRPGVDYSTFTVERLMDYHEAFFMCHPPAEHVASHQAMVDDAGLDWEIGCYENQYGYLGFSTRDTEIVGSIHEQWEQYSKEAYASDFHPRSYNMAMHQMKGCQDAGLSFSTWYGYQHGIGIEYTNQGHAHYGDFPGLISDPGRGDGSDDLADNRLIIADEDGLPIWPDYTPRVSPRAGARAAWQAAIGEPPPEPPEPPPSRDIGPYRLYWHRQVDTR